MVLFLTVPGQAAQSSPSVPNPHQAEFDEAVSSFREKHYDIALADFKKLMGEEPANPAYKKFASEAALDLGDADFVVQTLQPIEAAQPDDWQTHLLLARAYAQMVKDPHHAEKRDEEIALVTSNTTRIRTHSLVSYGTSFLKPFTRVTRPSSSTRRSHRGVRTMFTSSLAPSMQRGSPAFVLRWKPMTSISRSLPRNTRRKLQPGSAVLALTATPQTRRAPTAEPSRLTTPMAFLPGSRATMWCANAFSQSPPVR
jgi:hypothetical protein